MITAPYNFVPLNKEVFYPEWSEQVSHDIPFEDGESGEIEIAITAKSPIFIRDHEKKEEFCQHNGQYYIPSTSIKGMVRNVMEIMSFGKMNPDFVDDKTYAVRDLRNPKLYMDYMKPQQIFCGWLKKIGNTYKIEDCGTPGRISQDKINRDFGAKFKAQKGGFINKADFKTAKYKYDLLANLNIPLNQYFKFIENDKGREIYEFGDSKQGILVVTGQASGRKDQGKFDGKIYEFVFFNSKNEIEVSEEVMEKFKFAYFDDRKTEPKESPDWKYWKEKLESRQKVPVFFQKDGTKIKHFGLSYLYKLPYTHSIKDGIPKSHFESEDLDLAQTIFGYISKNNKEALKGRVQFSHFKAIQNIEPLKPRTEILGTPRASYYPIYVRQQDGKLYKTFMDGDFEIAGRKRYPIHSSNQTTNTTDTGNDNVGTIFTPLKEGVVFKGKLRYHNLKRVEIGAILSAITFHDTENTFYNIGLAKALGYGKIKIEIKKFHYLSYLQEFERLMVENIENWPNRSEIQELLTMATEQENNGNSKLEYMKLEPQNRIDEFADIKRDRLYLKNYSKLDNISTVKVSSLISKPESLKQNFELNKEIQKEVASPRQETIQKQPQLIQEDPSNISKSKMRKAISASWQRIFEIYYHPNQIKEFFEGEFKTTPQEQAAVYTKIKDNQHFVAILKEIDKFNKDMLDQDELKKLYEVIINLK